MLIDIDAAMRVGKGTDYKVFNVKQLAKAVAYLKEHGDMSYVDLQTKTQATISWFNELSTQIKSMESRLSQNGELQKHIVNYSKKRAVYIEKPVTAKNSVPDMRRRHTDPPGSKEILSQPGVEKLPTIKTLREEYAEVLEAKRKAYAEYKQARAEMRELQNVKANIDYLAGAICGKNAGKRTFIKVCYDKKANSFSNSTQTPSLYVTLPLEVQAMSKMILIIEDEKSIQNIIKAFLEDAGYTVVLAADGLEGIEQFRENKPDLVLLDLMLPKIDGFAVCEILRKESRVPIIMLTALDDDASQMKGFDALADDYITKPFSMPLVVKHIEAVLRRAEQGAGVETNILRYKDLTLDTDSFTVLVKDESVSLTIREFEILKLLVENQGRVFTRESLLDSIWGYDYFGDEKIVNTHIKNIRKKLGVDYIETIRGAGYKIEKEN